MNVRYAVSWWQVSWWRPGRVPAWTLLASLSLVLVLAAAGCERHESSQAPKAQQSVEVSVISVAARDVPLSFEYIAQVQSSRQVNIQARVSGFLDKRVYTEGTVVKEGQTLFVMDQKPFKVQLDQAKAALARQEAAHEVARKNMDRVKPLTAADALSQKDLDDALGQLQSSAANVEQAKASVEEAKLNLSYTVITSPVTGITSAALQQDGTYLSQTNSQLTTVAVLSPTYVNFSISENDRLKYRDEVARGLIVEPKNKNYVAEIVLSDGSIFPHTGKVTFADPSFNAETGTFLIRATVDNPDGLLRPNQFVRLRLKGALRPNAILVPQRSVQQGAKGHFVWVVSQEAKAEYRPVVVGEWQGNDWVIYEGLRPGDQVVVDGGLTLRPGAPLKASPMAEKGRGAENAAPGTDSGKTDGK
jgi:membrane fusion protein, multidrug efflux system